jgi:hypothetical protein
MEKPILWHDAGFAAFRLELHEYEDVLQFQDNHPLSKEALKIDILIIKKQRDVQIKKNFARIFKGSNLVEYKPEKYSLSISDYTKVMGYAFLYSSFEGVPLADITVTFSIMTHPRKLLKYLKTERNLAVHEPENGIYYIEGEAFPVQIPECTRFSEDENIILRNLRGNLNSDELEKTYNTSVNLGYEDIRNAYLDRLVQANRINFKEMIDMSEAAREIYDEIAAKYGWDERAKKTGAQEAIKTVAKKLLLLDIPVEKVAKATELPVETITGLL